MMELRQDELANERWLPVVGYEGIYEVSDIGRVRSLDRLVAGIRRGKEVVRRWRGRIMKIKTVKVGGYSQTTICLSKEAVTKDLIVSGVVLASFEGNRPVGFFCAHNDGDATNNRYLNLRYATRRENEDDKVKHGSSKGERNASAKLTENQVLEIIKAREARGVCDIASDFGISFSQVSRIARGEAWRHLDAAK